jgi:hypothetical protein
MAAPTLDRDTILKAVRQWSADEQVALAKEILRHADAHHTEETQQPLFVPSGALRGILATDRPAPSDEEVTQWLDEHRMEKYGR